MKITVDVPVLDAQGKGGKGGGGKTVGLELDTRTREVTVHTPDSMLRTPVVGLAGLEAALVELSLAADAGKMEGS